MPPDPARTAGAGEEPDSFAAVAPGPPSPAAPWWVDPRGAGWPLPPPRSPAAVREAARPRSPGWRAVVIASLLAAVVASVGTAALVLPRGPRASATPRAAAIVPGGSPGSRSGTASTIIEEIAVRVSPAVVTIATAGTAPDTIGIATSGVGSGVIFRSDGLILTNYHVIEGGSSLTVTLTDGRSFAGRVVAQDSARDLAVVRVDSAGLPTAPLGTSSGVPVGALVVAIGSPLGTFTDSVTSGILSATGRSIAVRDQAAGGVRRLSDLLQTDAAINEGNSGGPLLDASGRVIGINTATAIRAEGIGFAIPIDDARAIVDQASS